MFKCTIIIPINSLTRFKYNKTMPSISLRARFLTFSCCCNWNIILICTADQISHYQADLEGKSPIPHSKSWTHPLSTNSLWAWGKVPYTHRVHVGVFCPRVLLQHLDVTLEYVTRVDFMAPFATVLSLPQDQKLLEVPAYNSNWEFKRKRHMNTVSWLDS